MCLSVRPPPRRNENSTCSTSDTVDASCPRRPLLIPVRGGRLKLQPGKCTYSYRKVPLEKWKKANVSLLVCLWGDTVTG